MTTVTITEARENLPELLRRAAAGEQIVITDEGKWLAALAAPPPPPPTPGEEAAALARREQIVREWLRLRADAPLPKPEEMTHEEYFALYRESE
jgi:antitoxin (DNA-binding transcriptional repressor) of toxin-antitoxin stability system